MPSFASRRTVALLALSLVLAACESGSGATPPTPTPGLLVPGTWFMHEADGDALPAKISERIVGVALEATMLDSAWLTIGVDDTYEQRYWTRVLVSGLLDRTEVVIDRGHYTVEGTGYRLTSILRTRDFTLSSPSVGNITTEEQMLFFASAPPITIGTYRLTHP